MPAFGLAPSSYLDRVTANDHRARWGSRISTGARQVAPGYASDILAGVVSWRACNEADVPDLQLISLYVVAEHRGTGVKSALLTHALGRAPALVGFREALRAHAFYAKSGLIPDGVPQGRHRHGHLKTTPDPELIETSHKTLDPVSPWHAIDPTLDDF